MYYDQVDYLDPFDILAAEISEMYLQPPNYFDEDPDKDLLFDDIDFFSGYEIEFMDKFNK